MTACHEEPATVEQLTAAMDALAFYTGSNDPGEHAAEPLRLGGPTPTACAW